MLPCHPARSGEPRQTGSSATAGRPGSSAAYIFTGDLFDDLRSGDKHAGLSRLNHEIGQRRTIGCSAGAGAADDGDLGNGSRELHVAVEDARIAVEAVDALLNACTTGVVDEDERGAGLERHDHHLDDLAAMHLSGCTAEDGKILAGQMDQSAIDGGCADYDAIGGSSFPAMPK